MTQKAENYRPTYIEFDVTHDGSPVPERLGEFESADEALLFMQKNFFSTNQGVTVNRYMDAFEKSELRKKVTDILENIIPVSEQLMRDAATEFSEAKQKLANATEAVNAYTNEAKHISVDVKRGLIDIKLDELYTWKLPYKGRYYFFTFIDKVVRLVKIADMSENEKSELFSQGKINEDAFENGEVTAQTGKKK